MKVDIATRSQEQPPKPSMVILVSGNKKFIGKSTFCRKFCLQSHNSPALDLVWFFNEIVYYEIARLLDLNMPAASVLMADGEMFFGSEVICERKVVTDEAVLRRLFSQDSRQLTRALILDLMLFNSDRTFGCNGDFLHQQEELFFIDHGHSLWGDGRCFGDLHRLEHVRYSSESDSGYLKGYLRCRQANECVWQESNKVLFQTEFADAKQVVPTYFLKVCEELEKLQYCGLLSEWQQQKNMSVLPRLVEPMHKALCRWARRLEQYLLAEDAVAQIHNCLMQKRP